MNKIVVLANCQAVPISRYIQEMSNECEVIETGIVHLLNDSRKEGFEEKFEEADYIIAQQVSSNYPCKFVTTESLLKDYSSKVISIVNLFFSGYNPELRYIRMAEKGVLKGPLGDYHIHAIIDGYKDGLSISETAALYSDFDYNEKRYKNSINNSLDELRSRDARTELQISDYIQDNLSKSKLFHTMNHPSEELLIKYSQMILSKMGVNYSYPSEVEKRESLAQITLPSNPYIIDTLKDFSDSHKVYKGRNVV